MKKTFKLIRLPSEKPGSLFTHMKKLIFSPGAKQNKAPETNPQILCILSDDNIIAGNWYYCSKTNNINKCIERSTCPFDKKIIASTDKEITPYSWIQESFVKAYVKASNEGHPIQEVDLEMANITVFPGMLNSDQNIREEVDINTRPDGSVIIRQSKTYSRSDVEKKIFDFNKWRKDVGKLGQNEPALIAKWIDENL